jgi:DNA replication protein
VLSGKYNFKYIDRILFEWERQNVRSVQELNMLREQYRNRAGNARNSGTGGPGKTRDKAPQKSGAGSENKYDAFYQSFGSD